MTSFFSRVRKRCGRRVQGLDAPVEGDDRVEPRDLEVQARLIVGLDDLAQAQLDGRLPLADREGEDVDQEGQGGDPEGRQGFELRVHQRVLRSRLTDRSGLSAPAQARRGPGVAANPPSPAVGAGRPLSI